MARRRWIWVEGRGLVEVATDHQPRPRVAIIGDQPERAFRSMADGKMYDSKSRYRAEVRARGLEEVGNDQIEIRRPEPPSAVEDICRTIAEMGVSL